MALHALTPAELAFLTAPAAETGGLPARLTRTLAATLSARLRQPVELVLQTAEAGAGATRAPLWQPDTALATLWLTRRLGGRRVAGAAPFVPRGLIDALNGALAEAWLGGGGQGVPAPLGWQVRADSVFAALALRLPREPDDMTRWARGVIRHG